MNEEKRKILVLVEGARTDVRLMEHLLQMYKIDAKYQIISYNTNIYALYNSMFVDGEPESMDILQILKERETNPQKKMMFDERFSDILLVFDFDPQDPQYSKEKISEMMEYFVESSDVGKLYLNYPMVEAFYHMKSIPDEEYNTRCVELSELKNHTYKQRVNSENRNRDYTKFATTREECNVVIRQNIEKSWYILGKQHDLNKVLPESVEVLKTQVKSVDENKMVFVLCTCVFFIVEYNSKLLKENV